MPSSVEPESTATAFYDHAAWYDILHTPGTAQDVSMIERFNRMFGRGGLDFLEPACGTGRHLRVLAGRGYRATGYDTNAACLSYARTRAASRQLDYEVVDADMTTFVRPQAFDVAFNLINTFRHLLSGRDAKQHLRQTAMSLRPGGIYILGVDLVDYEHPNFEEEIFSARRGPCAVRHIMMSLPPDSKDRLEQIINHITVTTPRRAHYFESTYDLRSYDLWQLKTLLRGLPFEIAATFDFGGREITLGPGTRDVNLILRRVD